MTTKTKYTRGNLKVQDWFDEIDTGLDYRRQFGIEDKWHDLEALYYNVHKSQKISAPNIMYSHGDTLLSELSVPVPYMMVEPTQPQSVDTAPILESIDNQLLWDVEIPEQFELAYLHTFLWGAGFLKLGYDSEWGFNPAYDIGANTVTMGMTSTMYDKQGKSLEFNTFQPGNVWTMASPPHDWVFPWGTIDVNKCPWYFHRVVRHIEDIKKDVKYSNKRNLQPTMSMEDFVNSYKSKLQPWKVGEVVRQTGTSKKREFCELWEGHNMHSGRVVAVASGHDRFLRNDPDYLQTESGPPLVHLSFVPRARALWVTPDAYYLLHHQAEEIDIAYQAMKQRRIGCLKFGYLDGAISPDELTKALGPDVGAGFKVKAGYSLKDALQPFQPGNNMLLNQEMEYNRRYAREVMGFSRNRGGEFEGGRRTASEAMIVQQSGNTRMSRRHKAVQYAYVSLFKKINSIITRYWKTPRVTSVLGNQGEKLFVRFVGQELRGKYRLRVDFSTEAGTTLQSRRQQALMLYSGLAQDPMVDQAALRQYLVHAYNDPELMNVFKLGNSPQASRQVMAQGQPLQKGNVSNAPVQLPMR